MVKNYKAVGIVDFEKKFLSEQTKELANLPYSCHQLQHRNDVFSFFIDQQEATFALIISGSLDEISAVASALYKLNPALPVIYWQNEEVARKLSIKNANTLEDITHVLEEAKGVLRTFKRVDWPLELRISRKNGRKNIEAKILNISAGGAYLTCAASESFEQNEMVSLFVKFNTPESKFQFYVDVKILRVKEGNDEKELAVEFINVSLATHSMIDEIINMQIKYNLGT
ncbi:MAG: PilZ domain-containing protein [Spirochaetaceae bacterium]|nr:PilZ domain-containing protein [Spirochaetaceae bacterium]